MKKCMVLAILVAGTMGGSAEDLVIQSFETDGTITFNAISNATAYQVDEEVDGVWSNSASIPANGSGTVTATVSMADQSMLYCVEATVTTSPVPVGMVWIPGGTNSGTDPEFGAYSLTVESFYMDRYEVTKALWDEVKNSNGGDGYSYDNAGRGKASDHPVFMVNWFDCVKWCNARSEKEGRTPVYYTDAGLTQVYKVGRVWEPYRHASATGYRLPTDVEWEYAARGGVSSGRFPWGGDTIQHARANYYSSSSYSYDTSPTRGDHPDWNDGVTPYTSPVGTFELGKNGYGLYDMAGNVFEWCFDWHPDHEGSERVAHGGRWNTGASRCQVAKRGNLNPDNNGFYVGLRAVLPPDQQ